MSRSPETVVCDRRILKAFYTQYVAVLLIILVFSVGAFQRSTSTPTGATTPALLAPSAASIGSMRLRPDFDNAGALVGESAELEAIASFVREHDIRAIVTLSTSERDESAELAEIEGDLARLDALRSYFTSQGLPEATFQFVLGGASAQEGEVTVQFEEHQYDNLPL